ncbi:23S rRNA (guanosine(2251)-2'-O)-methyltransferase RlmB [Mycoplasma sp. 1199]|uniref:23S rRNA (guanosine(2251)-2'-O)-methyltransferase RlmB n=1 Tax=Mycoplasma sp. 1199 TaxID=3108526 RepID=UPI002B1E7DA4|nr:23S rRNA (guanosine(2251)-2'-O)-methyltransferase RlmB [Mycoplasma sp. 1199]MEA4206298.1 23S rRNA (guanosine(2251)-2'-O)-methyltransferase RlmB [Mycoplasma sp. 1199]
MKKLHEKQKKYDMTTKKVGELIVYGKNSVIDCVNNKLDISEIHLTDEGSLKYFKDDNTLRGIKIVITDKKTLDEETKENHQGFKAILKSVNYKGLDDLWRLHKDNSPILVLDKIQDPHNFGAIIRTANAGGIKHIIFPKDNAAVINSTVLKVSSGGFVNMNFYRVNSLNAALTQLKKRGYWVYSTVLDEKALPYTTVEYDRPTILVVGNEGDGVSKSVLSVTDQTIYIPQRGNVQSLNVSVATGIIVFDALTKW